MCHTQHEFRRNVAAACGTSQMQPYGICLRLVDIISCSLLLDISIASSRPSVSRRTMQWPLCAIGRSVVFRV